MGLLLSHYWTPDDPPELRRAQAEDWIGDLAEFPIGIIEGACTQWRREKSRRPTPADIRKLATAAREEAMRQRALPPPAHGLGAPGDRLCARIGAMPFGAWFAGVTAEVLADGGLRLVAPSKFIRSWIARNYEVEILSCWEIEQVEIVVAVARAA
jgi:hypothetical protein